MTTEEIQRVVDYWPRKGEISNILKGIDWRIELMDSPDATYCPRYLICSGPRRSKDMAGAQYYGSPEFKLHAQFSLVQFPGCCGAMISYHAAVFAPYHEQGLGTLLNELRKYIARARGYTILLATDLTGNEPQRKILRKNGWKDIYTFTNRRTWNSLALSVVQL
jgi:hypothetical protein